MNYELNAEQKAQNRADLLDLAKTELKHAAWQAQSDGDSRGFLQGVSIAMLVIAIDVYFSGPNWWLSPFFLAMFVLCRYGAHRNKKSSEAALDRVNKYMDRFNLEPVQDQEAKNSEAKL